MNQVKHGGKKHKTAGSHAFLWQHHLTLNPPPLALNPPPLGMNSPPLAMNPPPLGMNPPPLGMIQVKHGGKKHKTAGSHAFLWQHHLTLPVWQWDDTDAQIEISVEGQVPNPKP
jgi:hypothetical protein